MQINLKELFPSEKKDKKPIRVDVEVDNFTDTSRTRDIYESRVKYKKQVNEENLPIGNENRKGKVLRNQLDTWYERPDYAKYDFENRLLKFNNDEKLLKKINDTNFQLINFVTDAVQNFLFEYNFKPKHPKSIFNNLKVIKAYEKPMSYNDHLESLYVKFFNDVLNHVKYTNKIQNFQDYMNLFINWFIDQKTFATLTGFYESNSYNLYNKGVAFDFYQVKSEADKQRVLNDPRYPVINYVAKINGLRMDPNNPGRIIADLKSENLLEKYARQYFPDDSTNMIAEKVLQEYFSIVSLETVSREFIIKSVGSLSKFYTRFAEKYSSYTSFDAGSDISQMYKKKFESNKIKRQPVTNETFRDTNQKGLSTINKFTVESYVKLRAIESDVTLSEGQMKFVVDKIYNLLVTTDQLDFNKALSKNELLSINHQAVSYLESFLFTQKNPGDKREFSFLWSRALKEITEEEIQLSKLLAGLDAIRIGCKGTHIGPDGLFLPCKTPEELFSLTNKE